MLFNEDGTWSGETGCQVIYGTWELQSPDDPDTGMFAGTPARLSIGPAPSGSEIGSCSPDSGSPLNLPIEFDSTYLISLRENSVGIRNVDASESDSFIPMRRIQ